MTERNPDQNPEHDSGHDFRPTDDDTQRIPPAPTSGQPSGPPSGSDSGDHAGSPFGETSAAAASGSTHRYQDTGEAGSPYNGPGASYPGSSSPYNYQREHIGGFGFGGQERERNRECARARPWVAPPGLR